MIGRVFNGRYRITERIGIGGMAEVYKAEDQVLGRTVAVKVMLPQYAADSDFTARFKQEAASAANLQSPYIVNVYDWGQDGGTYFIVMEFVRGTDLKSAIKQRGAINQRKVAEIGSQVCQALSVAHNLDIAHRDIKPQNIMVQPDGNVKVMDFGIARAKNSVKTQTSSVLGTAHYISPEQAQGKELDGRSDIYSLGCVLYEAATGQLPFDGPDAVGVAMRQVNEEPLPPSQFNPEIYPDLEDIILKAMTKDPAGRFGTAREMKQALDDFLMGRPVNLGGISSAATQVISTPDSTAVMSPIESEAGKTTSYRSNDDGKEKKSKKKTVALVVAALFAIAVIALIAVAIFGTSSSASVPDVTGYTEEAAREAIEAAGYVVGEVTEEYSSDTVSGRVIRTDPEANTALDEGETVNIVISLGAEKGTVPDLSGMTAEEAQQAIEDAGFVASFGGNENSDATENTVSSQDPVANTEADKGTTVTYWISIGPEDVDVPDVIGKTQSVATSTLTSAGFSVNVESGGYSDEYAKGVVMSQSPSGGSSASEGATITIYISQGSEPVQTYKVSDYLYEGMTVSQLRSLNLPFSVSFSGDSSGSAIVTGWSPTTVSEGGTVTVSTQSASSSSSGDTTDDDTDSANTE